MMPLLLRNWNAALLRLGKPQPLPTALFSRPTSQPRSLKDERLELIQPWRYSNEKPPFTTGELIVMMLVISGIAMRLEDIEIHILLTFDYYNQQAVRTQARRRLLDTAYEYDGEDYETEALPDFYAAVTDFEHPACVHKFRTYFQFAIDTPYAMISATTGAARLYLRNRLEPARGKDL